MTKNKRFDINILINFTYQPTFWNNLYDKKKRCESKVH
jgi:hypothetical protein